MTEIPERNDVLLFSPTAFAGALVLAPLLVGLLGLPLIVPPLAVIFGAPLWLGLGTPALLWMVGRYPPRFGRYALMALAGHLAFLAGAALLVWLRPDLVQEAQGLLVFYLIFGSVFALLWGGTFATLYRKFNHMADAFGPSL